MLVLATPINKGPFVISGGFQFIDTYLASRAGGIRVRGAGGDICPREFGIFNSNKKNNTNIFLMFVLASEMCLNLKVYFAENV